MSKRADAVKPAPGGSGSSGHDPLADLDVVLTDGQFRWLMSIRALRGGRWWQRFAERRRGAPLPREFDVLLTLDLLEQLPDEPHVYRITPKGRQVVEHHR